MLRLAVFASGRGSNLEAIYESIFKGTLHGIELALVISNNSGSGALTFARKINVPGIHLSLMKYENDGERFDHAMLSALQNAKIDIIALAGYMKKLPSHVIENYRGKIVNIHPSLLPNFSGEGMFGMNVHQAVIASNQKISGASVHIVEDDYDSGTIILQESCPVLDEDTPESLAERIKSIEHNILPRAIQMIADNII